MVKTTKGGKTMNPTDAYRKELRKKELKRNKKERKKVREVGILKKDPETLKDQIDKLETMKADGALDKARKHKKRQLEDTLNLVLKKRKEYQDKMKEKGEAPVMFSHLGSVRPRTTAEEDERAKHPRPEDSVYYHPTLNPSGAPPPGKLPMFKSSIGPRVPLSEASTSNQASSTSEAENTALPPPLPPPPPPPLPVAGLESGDGSISASFPLPPPPPPPSSLPPKPPMADISTLLPPPPPPPGPPPKELLSMQSLLPPPPPPIHQSAQLPPPITYGIEQPVNSDDSASRKLSQMPSILLPPPPPPPPRMPLALVNQQPQGPSAESETESSSDSKDVNIASLQPPPPPPPIPGASMVPNMRPDIFAPGISRFPLPPPRADVLPSIPAPGIPGRPVPPGAMAPPMFPIPSFGPPPIMRPPLPPGPPPLPYDDFSARPSGPQKPSYVKSAASTVVKRPLAQHNPELTSMVPASVRVRRESTQSKPKPKTSSSSSSSIATSSNRPVVTAPPVVQESAVSSAQKPQSIDDSYMAFLEDMKALGALDG